MNEDLRPLYDIESSWEIIEGQAGIQALLFEKYDHPGLIIKDTKEKSKE